jgi:DNA-binding SARP family transcriptional activator
VLDRNADLGELVAGRMGLEGELLPDWYDDWVALERERFRELRIHAFEALSARLISAERFGEAMDIALAAVRCEPLRESTHRAVISVHLARGTGRRRSTNIATSAIARNLSSDLHRPLAWKRWSGRLGRRDAWATTGQEGSS